MNRFSLSIKATLTALLGVFLLGWAPARAQVTVNLPTLTAQVGSTVDLPMTVSDLTGLGVTSYEFTVAYDPTFIRITGVSVSGTLSAVTGARPPEINLGTPGQITVAFASPSALAGAGTLLNLQASYDSRGTSPLTFNSFFFNEGTPASATTDGAAIVPTLAIVIPLGNAGTMGVDTTVPVNADDLTGLGVFSYQFAVTYDPAVVNVTGVSVAGTISDGAAFETNTTTPGRIEIRVARATVITGTGVLVNLLVTPTGPGMSAMDFANFLFNEGTPTGQTINGNITISANGAPVIMGDPGPIVIWELDTFTNTFTATDPEGAAVTLSLTAGAGTANVTFDAATGVFTFNPDLTQAGNYTFTVTADDGAITSSVTFAVTVRNRTELYATPLSGVHENPAISSAGTGNFNVDFDEGAGTIAVTGCFSGLASPFAAAHIHAGAVGANGGPAVALAVTADADGRGGCFDAVTYDLATSLLGGTSVADFVASLKNGNLYVNVHSAGQPAGELRGQVLGVLNSAPGAAQVRAPASFTIAGSGASNAFNVSWLSADDPDGDTVHYMWQVALDDAFTQEVVTTYLGDTNGFSITVAEAAQTFDELTGGSPGNVNIGGSVTFFHRVITTDGSRWTAGAHRSLTLTRGLVTANEDEAGLPTEFALQGNYPNPFNPTTAIRFDLPENAMVSVTVVDMLGRTVMNVPTQQFTAGSSRILQLDGASLASGTYVYRVLAVGAQSTHVSSGSMTLLK